MPIEGRSYLADNFYFILDGVKCGFLQSVAGGAIYADVIAEPRGPEVFRRKHLGPPKYEEFSIQVGFSLASALYEWMAAVWAGSGPRRSGAIIVCDSDLNARTQWEFANAFITETTIPACDGASKEPAYLTLRFAPESTRFTKATGKVATELGKAQKIWLPSNFRLEIEGLDCSKVSKIDSFTVKQMVAADEIGDARNSLREPGKLEFPNLSLTLSEATADSWFAWHEDFVIKGNNHSTGEKNGALTLLTPNGQTELARVTFSHLGIFKLASEKAEANTGPIKRVRAELYCEEMKLQFGDALPAG